MRERIIKHGRRVKRNPKAAWRARAGKRKEIRSRFRFRKLPVGMAPAHDVVSMLDREIAINKIKNKHGKESGIAPAVLKRVGFKRALEFVRAHADVYIDLSYNGFDKKIFGDHSPLDVDKGSLTSRQLKKVKELQGKTRLIGMMLDWSQLKRKANPN